MFRSQVAFILGAALWLTACGEEMSSPQISLGNEDQAFSSAEATLLDFQFDGELYTTGATSTVTAKQKIQDQLLYTIGHLNGNRAVGRLDRLVLSNIRTETQADGQRRVSYRAVLPVAWAGKTNLPTRYTLTLPRRVTYEGLAAFTQQYGQTCVDASAHDVDAGSMWYYFRPARGGCKLAPEDVLSFEARVTPSAQNTSGKYPELHKVWEDGALRFVAIFGKNEDGATTTADVGIVAYNRFVQAVRAELAPHDVTTLPANVPAEPGIAFPDVTVKATLPDGKTVTVHALLVDNVRTAGPTFDARYSELSPTADVLMYNGHAGLGSNVRALARKGRFVKGQYVIVFMNGCDTFAYVDGSLAETRARLNPDDPTGTRYMDMVTNAMPAFFHQLPNTSMALLRGLLRHETPVTYEQLFRNIDRAQVVVVTGEEDNVFTPGLVPGGEEPKALFREEGSVAYREERRAQTAQLAAGKYQVVLAPASAQSGGDADLYVRVGAAPTATAWDCRPYQKGSSEQCAVTLTAPAVLHLLVTGYAQGASPYVLTVLGEQGTGPGQPGGESWTGLDERFTVVRGQERRFETPVVPAGSYVFELSGGGDADLYVKKGAAASTTQYDCRPYRPGSSERCVVSLAEPAALHVLVRGYSASSEVRLVARKE